MPPLDTIDRPHEGPKGAFSVHHGEEISPRDPADSKPATRWCAHESSGSVFLRMRETWEPNLTSEHPPQFTHIRLLSGIEGWKTFPANPSNWLLARPRHRSRAMAAKHFEPIALTCKPLNQVGIAENRFNFPKVLVEIPGSASSVGINTELLPSEIGARCRAQTFRLRNFLIHSFI